MTRPKSKLADIGCVAFVIVILVVAIYAGVFQTEEMNQLFNWIFRSH